MQDGSLSREEFLGCLNRFGLKLRKGIARDLTDSLIAHDRDRDRDGERDGERGRDRDRDGDGERGNSGVDYNQFMAVLKAENETEGNTDGALETLRHRMKKEMKQGAEMREVNNHSSHFCLTLNEFSIFIISIGII